MWILKPIVYVMSTWAGVHTILWCQYHSNLHWNMNISAPPPHPPCHVTGAWTSTSCTCLTPAIHIYTQTPPTHRLNLSKYRAPVNKTTTYQVSHSLRNYNQPPSHSRLDFPLLAQINLDTHLLFMYKTPIIIEKSNSVSRIYNITIPPQQGL